MSEVTTITKTINELPMINVYPTVPIYLAQAELYRKIVDRIGNTTDPVEYEFDVTLNNQQHILRVFVERFGAYVRYGRRMVYESDSRHRHTYAGDIAQYVVRALTRD